MNATEAKTELIVSHYLHALNQACDHFRDLGDVDGLQDIRRTADSAVDVALQQVRPARRLEQQVTVDPETGRQIG